MKDDVTDYPPAPPRRLRAPRQRSRDFDWWDQRERDETVACPPRPKGCGQPIGSTCVNRDGTELQNFPAHLSRTKRATRAEPTTDPAAHTATTEETP